MSFISQNNRSIAIEIMVRICMAQNKILPYHHAKYTGRALMLHADCQTFFGQLAEMGRYGQYDIPSASEMLQFQVGQAIIFISLLAYLTFKSLLSVYFLFRSFEMQQSQNSVKMTTNYFRFSN
jgi:hypothetical protein